MYITYKLLAVKSSTTALLLAVWGVSVFTTYILYADYIHIVSCQVTDCMLSLIKVVERKHASCYSIPQAREFRPLDTKSIARYAEFLVIKGDTMTLKMGMSTFLTC